MQGIASYEKVCTVGGGIAECGTPGALPYMDSQGNTLFHICIAGFKCKYVWDNDRNFGGFVSLADNVAGASFGLAPALLGDVIFSIVALIACPETGGVGCVIGVLGLSAAVLVSLGALAALVYFAQRAGAYFDDTVDVGPPGAGGCPNCSSITPPLLKGLSSQRGRPFLATTTGSLP